ncbi:hypothetical protein NMG60_11026068 [Bertholletia excelsa]
MACLDINSDHKGLMSPRISFSNDFVETHHQQMVKSAVPRAAPSSDFEFSVTGYSMMTADELFFKGRLLPLKEQLQLERPNTTTLKDELLAGDEEDENEYSGDGDGFSLRPPKGWKGILGLKKAHIGSKKPVKSDGPSQDIILSDGGAICRAGELGK